MTRPLFFLHVPAHIAAEPDGAHHRHLQHHRGRGHHHRGFAELSGLWAAAERSQLGRPAEPRGPQLHAAGAVAGHVARHLPDHRGVQLQHVRRRGARPARPPPARRRRPLLRPPPPAYRCPPRDPSPMVVFMGQYYNIYGSILFNTNTAARHWHGYHLPFAAHQHVAAGARRAADHPGARGVGRHRRLARAAGRGRRHQRERLLPRRRRRLARRCGRRCCVMSCPTSPRQC